jgi:hypothetical protein
MKEIWEAKLQIWLVQKLWKKSHGSLELVHEDESVGKRKPSFYVRFFQICNINGVLVPSHAHSVTVTLKFSLFLIYIQHSQD